MRETLQTGRCAMRRGAAWEWPPLSLSPWREYWTTGRNELRVNRFEVARMSQLRPWRVILECTYSIFTSVGSGILWKQKEVVDVVFLSAEKDLI